MKRESGEIVIGLLVGLAVGGIMAWFAASNQAQEMANSTGQEQDILPHVEWSKVLVTGAAGAGIGWALDEIGGESGGKSQDNTVRISDINNSSVNVTVRGNSDDDSRTDTRMNTETY